MSEPQVLVVTSPGASAVAVTPVLAAIEAAGMRVRAVDAGRVGARHEGTVERVFRAITGELGERRLHKALVANPPDVVVCFDPGTAGALSVARDEMANAAPVLAVVTELEPAKAWGATDADRYLVLDEEAAVDLADLGVDGGRIIPIGAVCEHAFSVAAAQSREALRSRFKIAAGPVVVIEVAGFGYDTTSQLALQLSLTGDARCTYLFDAGTDSDAAAALRRQVPNLDMRAKLFGATSDSPALWRCADAVVARPREAAVAHSLMLGLRFVAFGPEGAEEEANARGLAARGLGATAGNTLLLASVLEEVLGGKRTGDDSRVGSDGADNVADVAWVIGSDRRAVLDERRRAARESTHRRVDAAASAAEAYARTASAPGDLEDLSGGHQAPPPTDVPDVRELDRLRAEVEARKKEVGKDMMAARTASDTWEGRATTARAKGEEALAAQASARAADERQRMHALLAEMAQLDEEARRLDKAIVDARSAPPPREPPPAYQAPRARSGAAKSSRRSVDDMLDDLKKKSGGGTSVHAERKRSSGSGTSGAGSTIDDELAALKRKMQQKKTRK